MTNHVFKSCRIVFSMGYEHAIQSKIDVVFSLVL